MRTYAAETPAARPFAETLEAAAAALVQDASEYGITALAGGTAACFAVVALRLMHNPVADALIAPAVVLALVLTFATSAEAFARVSENLQPDAAAAFRTIVSRAGSFAQPWMLLSAGLFFLVLALLLSAGPLGPWPNAGLAAAVFLIAILYAYPRSYCPVALVAGVRTAREAALVSVALVDATGRSVLLAWTIAGAPAAMVSLIGLASGFGAASAGLAALVAVASMPLAAAMLSLLFADASARARRRT